MGRKSLKEKAKSKYKNIEDKVKEEASRAANDLKQMLRDGNEKAKKCLDIVNKKGVEICSKDTKEPLKEITTQRLDYNHPNADDCLKEFAKEGFIPCSDIPSTALLCLERLKNAGNELCNKAESRPLLESDISSVEFNFNEHSADFSLKCYTTITKASSDFIPCDTLNQESTKQESKTEEEPTVSTPQEETTTTPKATAELCLKHLTDKKELCTKDNIPVTAEDLSTITFSFDENSATVAEDCYSSIIGHNNIGPCTHTEGDL